MNPFRQINLQELSAKQKKIDINKNNKVDGEDLSALRKDGMKEAAKPDFIDIDKDGNKKESMKKASTDKMKKEAVEELDELDKKTLASYAFKAANQAADKTGEYEKRMNSADRAGARVKDGKLAFAKDANKVLQQHDIKKAKEARAVASKRLSGLNKAVSKLAFKEDKDKDDKDEKSVDRLSRSDYKMSPSGRKSHKQIVFGAKMKEETEIEIDESADAGLAGKASKSGISIGVLRKVYRRGVAAWNSGHRPGTTPQQWGMARVNSYIGKGSGTYHGADKDLREEELDEKSDQAKQNKTMKNTMDASRGARFKLNNPVPTHTMPDGSKMKGRAHNVAIGRALRNEDAEELEEGRMKDIVTNAQETDRLKKQSVPFDGPYTKTPATTTDKSGAVHSAMSRAKHLARQAMKNVKEEVVEEGAYTNPGLEALYAKKRAEKSYAPVAPVPDKKYIKGTPEHTAYKATKKPINGMPTNVAKEELVGNQHKIDKNKNGKIDAHDFKLLRKEEFENGELQMNSFKSYIQEDMDESMFPGSPEYKAKFGNDKTRGKVGSSSRTSMGTQTVTDTGVKHQRDYDKAEKQSSAPAGTEKRGRGRPAGAASGARQKGSAVKSDDRYDSTGYKLHLPVRR